MNIVVVGVHALFVVSCFVAIVIAVAIAAERQPFLNYIKTK